MKVTFLVDNKTETIGCEAEWGLSMVVEANGKMILMDQGASDMLMRNAERLGVDLAKVDFATISHGHYDHSTGTPAFFGLNRTAPVYVHEQAFFYEIDSLGDRNIGIPWSEEFIRENDFDDVIIAIGAEPIRPNIPTNGCLSAFRGGSCPACPRR